MLISNDTHFSSAVLIVMCQFLYESDVLSHFGYFILYVQQLFHGKLSCIWFLNVFFLFRSQWRGRDEFVYFDSNIISKAMIQLMCQKNEAKLCMYIAQVNDEINVKLKREKKNQKKNVKAQLSGWI